jgi:hypothetical protein
MRAATGVMILFVVFSLVALVQARRRKLLGDAWSAVRSLLPTAALFIGFIAIGGGFLASKYEAGNAQPFVLLGAGVLPLVLLARVWSVVGSQTSAARLGRSLLCGITVMATAFVLLESVNPQYLEGFGL